MAEQGYPNFSGQQGARLYVFKVDGSEVTTSSSTSGLDGRGQALATIKDDGANVQTITWNQKFSDVPYVFLQPLTANGSANIAVDEETLVLTGVERDDNTQALANQDFYVFVYSHDTTQFIL